jgi:hypothetical protein
MAKNKNQPWWVKSTAPRPVFPRPSVNRPLPQPVSRPREIRSKPEFKRYGR